MVVVLLANPTQAAIDADAGKHLGSGTPEGQETQQPLFRADVHLATHHVAVLDHNGDPVPDLEVAHFRVYEDEVTQKVSVFLRPTDTPLDVGLLLDSSDSMLPYGFTVRRAAKTFLGSMGDDDCVYLLPFNDDVGPGRWGRAVNPAFQSHIDQIDLYGGTALYDAVLGGLDALEVGSPGGDEGAWRCNAASSKEGAPTRRRALVLLTDGADENSTTLFADLIVAARTESVPIFPVALGQALADGRLRERLEELARGSGGRVIESARASELHDAYSDVLNLLRASYVLGYVPTAGVTVLDNDPQELRWHNVRIRLLQPNYRLVYREGYFR